MNGWVVLPQTRPNFLHGVEKTFRLDVMQPFQKHSNWWLGRAPQQRLSRPSSFHGGKHRYHFDVMHTFNNVQMNGWSSCPKHSPAQITVLSQFFVRLAWNFSKTIKSLAGSCSPKTRSNFIHSVEKLFRLSVMQPFKNNQNDGWAALPNFPCHGPAHFTALNKVFFWCFADFQQRSNKRLVVLPQTRSSSIHGVESFFRPDGMKLFKYIQSFGWVVLPKTRSKSIHSVEKIFCRSVMQPFKKFQIGGWTALFNILYHGPAQFTTLNNLFFWCYADIQQPSNERLVVLPKTRSTSYHGVESTFRPNRVKHFKNHQKLSSIVLPQTRPSSFHGVQEIFRVVVMQPFRKHSNWWLGRASQHPLSRPSLHRGVKHLFVLMLCRLSTTFKERLVVLPQTRSSSLHSVEQFFRLDVMQPIQTLSNWRLGRAPQHLLSRPSSFHGGKHGYRFDVMQTFNNVQMNGWSCSPKHGPAHITALRQLFVRMA